MVHSHRHDLSRPDRHVPQLALQPAGRVVQSATLDQSVIPGRCRCSEEFVSAGMRPCARVRLYAVAVCIMVCMHHSAQATGLHEALQWQARSL